MRRRLVAEVGPVTRALLAIAAGDPDDERGLARQICLACVAGLDVDGASLSLLTTTASRQTLWASDPVAELLEDLQFSLNEGACIQAASSGVPVLVPDLAEGVEVARWPVFAAALAERTEIRAVFALPLQWGATNLGVLDLYRRLPGELSRSQWRDALATAEIATLLMLGLHTDPRRNQVETLGNDHTDGQLHDGGAGASGWLDSLSGGRAEVHQATGMVLVQLGVTSTEALARLRAHAFAHQRLLIDVARDVVDRTLVFTKDDK
ncbi:MAG TPA: GAF and ANTAR domain-containing protein [Pseudonocardia sp.]